MKLTIGHFLKVALSAESVFLGSSDTMHIKKKEEKGRKRRNNYEQFGNASAEKGRRNSKRRL